MDTSFVNCLLQSTLTSRRDLFGENCTFVSFEEADKDSKLENVGCQSSMKFGRIVYRRGDDDKVERSDHLLLKETPATMTDISTMQFFNEVCFYAKVIPFFKTIDPRISELFPDYYNSLLQYSVDSPDKGFILLENLQASDYSLIKEKTSFPDYDHLSLVMRKLGELHAYSYRAREAFPDKFHVLTHCGVETSFSIFKILPDSYMLNCAQKGFEPLSRHPDYSSKIENLRKIIENCNEVFRNTLKGDEDNGAHVLCHGDFHLYNYLFRYDENGKPNDFKMVDLANWRFASPVIDLGFVLYFNADQKMREENWDKLIDEYYTAVSNTFPSVKVPSKESILREFKTNAMHSYFMAANFLIHSIKIADKRKLQATNLKLRDDDENDNPLSEHPAQEKKIMLNERGDSSSVATLLTDILKDIIDRGFV